MRFHLLFIHVIGFLRFKFTCCLFPVEGSKSDSKSLSRFLTEQKADFKNSKWAFGSVRVCMVRVLGFPSPVWCMAWFLPWPFRFYLVNLSEFSQFPFVGTLQFTSWTFPSFFSPSLLLYLYMNLPGFWCLFWAKSAFDKRWPFVLVVWQAWVLISWRMRCLMSPVYRNNDRWLIWNSTDTAWPGMLRSAWNCTSLSVGSLLITQKQGTF